MPNLNIKTEDNVESKENLTNTKRWFNGLHTFSSVRIINEEEKPSVLEVNVADSIASETGLG